MNVFPTAEGPENVIVLRVLLDLFILKYNLVIIITNNQIPDLETRLSREFMQATHDAAFEVEGLSIAKFAVASLVMDMDGNILTCYHAERPGESPEGAIGSVTETLRYLRSNPEETESPVEALRRCLYEEHGIDDDRLFRAGFQIPRQFGIRFGRWPVGMYKGLLSTFSTFDVILRVEDPSVFKNDDRPSDEIVDIEFRHPESLVGTEEAVRPGYHEWLRSILSVSGSMSKQDLQPVEWQPLPKTSGDAIRPYVS